MSERLEARVLEILTRHLSRVTARVILEHGRRVLRDRSYIDEAEELAFLGAVKVSAWFFLAEHERATLGEALDRLGKTLSR